MYCIYKITNTINGKVYIGQTNNFNRRRVNHFSDLRCNRHHNLHLQNSFYKYGEDAFIIEVLENNIICPLVIDFKEKYYIKIYNSSDIKKGYNQDSGGKINRKFREDVKKRISISSRRLIKDPAYLDRLRKSRLGILHSEETKRKMRESYARLTPEEKKERYKSRIGIKQTSEHKNKIRNALIGIKRKKESMNITLSYWRVKVIQIDLNTNNKIEHDSIITAAFNNKLTKKQLYRALKTGKIYNNSKFFRKKEVLNASTGK